MTPGEKSSSRKLRLTSHNPRLRITSMGRFKVAIQLKEGSKKSITLTSSNVRSLELSISRMTRLYAKHRTKVIKSWLSKLEVSFGGRSLSIAKPLQSLLSVRSVRGGENYRKSRFKEGGRQWQP